MTRSWTSTPIWWTCQKAATDRLHIRIKKPRHRPGLFCWDKGGRRVGMVCLSVLREGVLGLPEKQDRTAHLVPPVETTDQSIDYVAWIAFSIMALFMGLTFVLVELSLEGFSLAQAAGGRMVISACVLIPMAIVFGPGLPKSIVFWKWAFLLSLLHFVLPFSLSTYGQSFLASNVVGTVFSLIPLMTIALSAAILGVHISMRKIVGILIGFLGLVVMAEPLKWGGEGQIHALPMLATLAAVACLASAAIVMRVMPAAHPLSLIGASALIASVFGIVPFASAFDGDLPSARAWIGILGVSILGTAVALSIRFFLIRRKGPVFLAPNAYIGVILANIFGVSFLGDSITLPMMVAFPLILIGLFIAQDGTGNMKQV